MDAGLAVARSSLLGIFAAKQRELTDTLKAPQRTLVTLLTVAASDGAVRVAKEHGGTLVAKCVDNSDIENSFAAGAEYVVEKSEEGPGWLLAYDDFGERRCFNRIRFGLIRRLE